MIPCPEKPNLTIGIRDAMLISKIFLVPVDVVQDNKGFCDNNEINLVDLDEFF